MVREVVDFLLARIAEDEAPLRLPDWYCTDSARGEGWGSRGDECPSCGRYMFDGTEYATKVAWQEHIDEAHGRLLAECEAKRDVIAFARHLHTLYARSVLEPMALPYSDHPDYDPKWRS